MTQKVYADIEYWDATYERTKFSIASANDPLRMWLEKTIDKVTESNCFEIGCFPGRYSMVLGELGYTLNGVDLTERLTELPTWLARNGYKTGKFYNEDFLDFESEELFDLVASFGFIEHFEDWRGLIRKHAALVKPGGFLVLETPNFRGFVQRLLHTTLDFENLKRHNLDAMRPREWAKILSSMNFEILECGYIGEFDFWHENKSQSIMTRAGQKLLRSSQGIFRILPQESAFYSPYIVLIAKRRR